MTSEGSRQRSDVSLPLPDQPFPVGTLAKSNPEGLRLSSRGCEHNLEKYDDLRLALLFEGTGAIHKLKGASHETIINHRTQKSRNGHKVNTHVR